jgi:hypothetical protein
MRDKIKEKWRCGEYALRDILFVLLPGWSGIGVGLILFMVIFAPREVVESIMKEVGMQLMLLIDLLLLPYMIAMMWAMCALRHSYKLPGALLRFPLLWLMPVGCSCVYFLFLRDTLKTESDASPAVPTEHPIVDAAMGGTALESS